MPKPEVGGGWRLGRGGWGWIGGGRVRVRRPISSGDCFGIVRSDGGEADLLAVVRSAAGAGAKQDGWAITS